MPRWMSDEPVEEYPMILHFSPLSLKGYSRVKVYRHCWAIQFLFISCTLFCSRPELCGWFQASFFWSSSPFFNGKITICDSKPFFAQGTWAAPPGWLWFWGDHDLLLSLDSGGGENGARAVKLRLLWVEVLDPFWLTQPPKKTDGWYIYIYVYVYIYIYIENWG